MFHLTNCSTALLLYCGKAAMEDRELEPLTSCMSWKRRNRRKSVFSNESRGLSDPTDTVLHVVSQR